MNWPNATHIKFIKHTYTSTNWSPPHRFLGGLKSQSLSSAHRQPSPTSHPTPHGSLKLDSGSWLRLWRWTWGGMRGTGFWWLLKTLHVFTPCVCNHVEDEGFLVLVLLPKRLVWCWFSTKSCWTEMCLWANGGRSSVFTENRQPAEFWGSRGGLVQIPKQHWGPHRYLLT